MLIFLLSGISAPIYRHATVNKYIFFFSPLRTQQKGLVQCLQLQGLKAAHALFRRRDNGDRRVYTSRVVMEWPRRLSLVPRHVAMAWLAGRCPGPGGDQPISDCSSGTDAASTACLGKQNEPLPPGALGSWRYHLLRLKS